MTGPGGFFKPGPDTPRHLVDPVEGHGGNQVQTKGVMACFVVERREAQAMIWASEGGDYTAQTIRIGIGLWASQAFAPNMPPQRCVECEYTFPDAAAPEAFFLAIPERGDGDSIVCGVCRACVRKIGSDSLLARCAEHFKRLWPKSRLTGISGDQIGE